MKIVKQFIYFGCNISSTKSDINMHTWKSDLSGKIKRDFFQAVAVSLLQYGCTAWTLMKCTKEKRDRNYTRILSAVLSKSWKKYPTKQQLYEHLSSISQAIWNMLDTAGKSKDELKNYILL